MLRVVHFLSSDPCSPCLAAFLRVSCRTILVLRCILAGTIEGASADQATPTDPATALRFSHFRSRSPGADLAAARHGVVRASEDRRREHPAQVSVQEAPRGNFKNLAAVHRGPPLHPSRTPNRQPPTPQPISNRIVLRSYVVQSGYAYPSTLLCVELPY